MIILLEKLCWVNEMPSFQFEARLVFDEHFYNKIIKTNPELLTKLMYINSCSLGHKRVSNIMSKGIFLKILNNNPSMPRSLLRSSFYDIELVELEVISDEIERVIKYAIHITSESPYKSIILTSDDIKEKYENNPHRQGVEEISVISGEKAMELIEKYWRECTDR